jgi:hypothetical protein
MLRSDWRFNGVIPGVFALPLSLIQNSAPYVTRFGTEGHFMNLHEYQSKQLFAEYAIPIPKGGVGASPEGRL